MPEVKPETDTDRITLQKEMLPNYPRLSSGTSEPTSNLISLFQKLTFGLEHLRFKNSKVRFTRRETDCIRLLLLGLTIKEISKLLVLSPRTVEVYLDNIKAKLGCTRKSQIVSALIEKTES